MSRGGKSSSFPVEFSFMLKCYVWESKNFPQAMEGSAFVCSPKTRMKSVSFFGYNSIPKSIFHYGNREQSQ